MESIRDTSEPPEEYLLPKEKVSYISIEGYPQVKLFRSVKSDDAPWILFLHGLTFYTDICASFINKLSRKYNVFSFDWPGVGATDAPADNVYTPQRLLSFAEKVINTAEPGLLSRNTSIVGHSLGGLMSLVLAMHYLEKGMKVANVVMLAPAGVKINKWMIHRILTAPVIGKAVTRLLKFFPNATAKRTVNEARYNFHFMPKLMEQTLWGPFETNMMQNPRRTAIRILEFAHFPWEEFHDLFVKLSNSGIPAIVVLAGQDVTIDTPATECFLREKCPSIRTKIYPGYTHDLVACNAQVVAEYVTTMLM